MSQHAQDNSVVVDRERGEHYRWGGVCDGWHLLRHPELSVIEERVPAGAAEVRHVHARARQFFYILSGQACIELAQGDLRLGAGQGAQVPPGVAHRFVNPGPGETVFLVISAPPTAGDRTNLD